MYAAAAAEEFERAAVLRDRIRQLTGQPAAGARKRGAPAPPIRHAPKATGRTARGRNSCHPH
jgi:hypothetical protein